jgi:hypothetical protein
VIPFENKMGKNMAEEGNGKEIEKAKSSQAWYYFHVTPARWR